MPIRINLLAEAQAVEELRRRDPVKRAVWAGAFLVGVFLVWSGILQFQVHSKNSQLVAIEDQLIVQSKQYDQIKQKELRRDAINRKLTDLQRIYANRFLWGSVLNALQQSVVKDVQLISFRGEQVYVITEEVKAKTNEVGKITTFPKPGGVIQKIRLQFDAKDHSPTPGDQVAPYKEALASSTYFQSILGKTNEITLRGLSPPSLDGESGKTVVHFTLDCRLPDKSPK